ncbi:MAG: 3,4-dihydroxy 2-butanone 4-phosphate synthase/GTP cyclohydrolase II [Urechidicola sp.]|jgi:3,4-dihydroxy 2-butanone 4-phosphate synthase/GTP cyclohydrolase II|tara:strand:+ start:316 stop:1440 length:1125 start_codon:yes stop_codon:yes gene_type:complete
MEVILKNIELNTIEEAIADIKKGKVVIVVDDENRENEGDFIAAAEMVTPEMINFMATHGRGLICAPITEDRRKELDLEMMVQNNTVMHHTQFTVSVDLIGHGCTTGISVHDRAKTIKALVNDDTKGFDLGKPGHIFPLRAKNGGVLRRTGHTEAAVDLARLAGYKPAGILVEILNEDGTMARLPQLIEVAKQFDLKLISIEDLVAYRMQHDSLIEKIEDFDISTRFGEFRLRAYKQTTNDQVHIALTKGSWDINEDVLVKVNSTLINNALGILTQNSDEKFERIFKIINTEKNGAIVFINQENQAQNVVSHLSSLKKDKTKSKIDMDKKDYGIGAQILHDLGISRLKVITNAKNTPKRVGMTGYGLEIVEYINY